ncbi:MAG: hypothetical protein K0S07_1729 [Chlamydiales bacterium]|nr:hypothetical protein [Chlamydiales bacterium]
MVPLLTPAIQEGIDSDIWEEDFNLLDRRTMVVALAALAAGVATVALAIFTASPLIIVGCLAIPAVAYIILQSDSNYAEKTAKARNMEDFCRLEYPSQAALCHIALDFDLIQRIVALKGDLNKTSKSGYSLLQSALSFDAVEISPSFERVRYMLEHRASPLKGRALQNALREEKCQSLLPLLLESIQEEEAALFKKDPIKLRDILNVLIEDSRQLSPLISDEIIFSLFARLGISLSDLETVALLGDEFPDLFAHYLSQENRDRFAGQGNFLTLRLKEIESTDL